MLIRESPIKARETSVGYEVAETKRENKFALALESKKLTCFKDVSILHLAFKVRIDMVFLYEASKPGH